MFNAKERKINYEEQEQELERVIMDIRIGNRGIEE